MIDFIKNSYKFEQELDNMEAKKCFKIDIKKLCHSERSEESAAPKGCTRYYSKCSE